MNTLKHIPTWCMNTLAVFLFREGEHYFRYSYLHYVNSTICEVQLSATRFLSVYTQNLIEVQILNLFCMDMFRGKLPKYHYRPCSLTTFPYVRYLSIFLCDHSYFSIVVTLAYIHKSAVSFTHVK